MAAAGLVGVVPGMSGLLTTAGTEAPEIEGDTAGAASTSAAIDGPVIAHIRDLSTGQISIYTGEREIIFNDPGLAARIARAAQ